MYGVRLASTSQARMTTVLHAAAKMAPWFVMDIVEVSIRSLNDNNIYIITITINDVSLE